VTFGAVTLMQTVGHARGLYILERSDPLLLLVSLPLVPVGLILGKMVRWEDAVSNIPYTVSFKYPLPISNLTALCCTLFTLHSKHNEVVIINSTRLCLVEHSF
jgi:hypothetical protein